MEINRINSTQRISFKANLTPQISERVVPEIATGVEARIKAAQQYFSTQLAHDNSNFTCKIDYLEPIERHLIQLITEGEVGRETVTSQPTAEKVTSWLIRNYYVIKGLEVPEAYRK